MKRIKPITQHLPRAASTTDTTGTTQSMKDTCGDLDNEECCNATAGCNWQGGVCKAD